jgi:hypothetical protein
MHRHDILSRGWREDVEIPLALLRMDQFAIVKRHRCYPQTSMKFKNGYQVGIPFNYLRFLAVQIVCKTLFLKDLHPAWQAGLEPVTL